MNQDQLTELTAEIAEAKDAGFVTFTNPTPGIHVTRTRIEPQPEGPVFLAPDNSTPPQMWLWAGELGDDSAEPWCLPPHAPGTYWVREPLRGVIDTKFTLDETMPICAYRGGQPDHIWTKDKAREPWRWGDRPTIPAEEMPREFSRYTATISVAVEREGGEWWWVTTCEINQRATA